jgi:Ni2+-binding GTPase involved in maturation of urease and hydrogenase
MIRASLASEQGALPRSDARGAPWVIVVGGFLGAGKTTLLLAAAKDLERRGLRGAVVLNDQSEGLVDTEFAALSGLPNGEVTGGCFCCRFSDLVRTLDKLRAYAPHVIFAEPVGSCTDISATTLHPLLEYGSYRLAPYTVLVDPERAKALLRSDADPNLAFLFRKQIEEADLVCFTKSDLINEVPEIGGHRTRQISAKTGQGVAAWLDEVLSGQVSAGNEILDIDYAQYAQAEAALAWLNLQATLKPSVPHSPAHILGPLLDAIDAGLSEVGIAIVHLKAIVHGESGFVKAAQCGNRMEPQVEGMLDASPASHFGLLVNLRCVGTAEAVKEIVERCLNKVDAEIRDLRVQAFHPAAPNPEHRVRKADVAAKAGASIQAR